MKCKGAVVVNAFWRGGDDGAKKIAEALAARGAEVSFVRTDELFMRIDGGVKGNASYDFAVYLDKDIHVARLLEESGVRLFNSAESIRLSDDKMLTHIALAAAGLPQPRTLSSPLCFSAETEDAFAERVAAELGFPIVVKKCHGAFGKQVYLARDLSELKEKRRELLAEPHLYQEYVECGASDIRVIVIGGKATCMMRRTASRKGEFRSNAELGGKGERIEPNEALTSLAERAATALGLDYCGVDILESPRGYLVTEVNSNAHFKVVQEVTGVDVAARYAEYMIGKVAI